MYACVKVYIQFCLSVSAVKDAEMSTFSCHVAITWQPKTKIYVYLIETKAVHSSAFLPLLVLPTILKWWRLVIWLQASVASFSGLQSQLMRWKAWQNSYIQWRQVDVGRCGLSRCATLAVPRLPTSTWRLIVLCITSTGVYRKCHTSQRLPDVTLSRSFTRPSTVLAVIEGLGTRLKQVFVFYYIASFPVQYLLLQTM